VFIDAGLRPCLSAPGSQLRVFRVGDTLESSPGVAAWDLFDSSMRASTIPHHERVSECGLYEAPLDKSLYRLRQRNPEPPTPLLMVLLPALLLAHFELFEGRLEAPGDTRKLTVRNLPPIKHAFPVLTTSCVLPTLASYSRGDPS
jgi:hypothetical protein